MHSPVEKHPTEWLSLIQNKHQSEIHPGTETGHIHFVCGN